MVAGLHGFGPGAQRGPVLVTGLRGWDDV